MACRRSKRWMFRVGKAKRAPISLRAAALSVLLRTFAWATAQPPLATLRSCFDKNSLANHAVNRYWDRPSDFNRIL